MASIDELCDRMRYWCDEGNLGYCQEHRWDIYEGGEADCSSLVIHCLQEAGFDTGDASYTGNMSDELCARGWMRVCNDGDPQRGDILLNDVHHVAVYIGDGLLCQASRNELHGANGGEPGDQDGWETNTRNYYDYPWDCYLRYGGCSDSSGEPCDNGDLAVDGLFGFNSCVRFQQLLGTEPDGRISSQWQDDAWRHAGCPAFEHDYSGGGSMAIRAWQQYLNDHDGAGLEVDGLCGEATVNATIQHYMSESGATGLDGCFSSPSLTIMAMQRAMNEGRL